ncbi:choice-of-anchor W domain-containing protein [Limnoraphis robusta]|uniref:Choice-of-anchor W domain-containing protein n=1 Tax=Limnoraphis robusta CCNP1315 TaxID=3110306 RepID=A0ABU5U1A2_9CYAN|nr:choice-of-anchor W domain-containing protein [Limnoraphis robusta]MEA5520443.1 choice-of-anchor W domain-containing protein [Limnoraphis robusta CCNP1315]MEA5546962.1 choice-of-anchor W domain-containing protein [Limnoraphis robusta CCNP1324]
MITENKFIALSATLGLTLANVGLTQSATALQLEPVTSVPSDWTSLGWKVEGRAGVFGGADYEWAIGPNGAQADNTGQIYWDWENGVEVNWFLNWDGITASFGVENLNPVSYSVLPHSQTVFEGFSLLTVAQTETGFVEAGTEIKLAVNQVNGIDVQGIFSQSLAPENGTDLNGFAWTSDTLISSLAGTARISWNQLNPNQAQARSRLDFQIVGFDINSTPASSIPEPSSILGLLTLGVLGLKHRFDENKARK